MTKNNFLQEPVSPLWKEANQPIRRATFLKVFGATVTTSALLLAGCKKDDDNTPMNTAGVDLGSGDIGILNYAYALEQLEAAFYKQVMTTPYSGMTPQENAILADLRDHEAVHRDFFKKALGSKAIQDLEVDFSSVNFSSRDSVLKTAKALEDTGVAAYNGAGRLITNPDYLTLAGKIVSVEARHASAIRDLLNPMSAEFAGDDIVMAPNGFDAAKTPAEILMIAGPFIKTKINAGNLPQ